LKVEDDHSLGPTTELTDLLWQVIAAHLPRDLTWPILLLTGLLATGIWLARRGHGAKDAGGRERKTTLLQFLLPKDIYSHVSARVDVALYVFERFLRPLWVAPVLVLLAPATEQTVIATLDALFEGSPRLISTTPWMVLYSLVTLLIYDAIFYFIHYCEHKIPALWAIHKVHHSAEVLTPLTRYREHFIEGPLYAAGAAMAYGLAGGLFGWLFVDGITQATLFNIGVFALLFGFNGSFRHYHVSFHYPRWLSKWLHSPVMHHVHHSYLPQHWDKNLAAVTSIWDRLFNTLYIPEKDEETPWGLGPETQGDYRTFLQNTLGPFRDWYGMAHGLRQARKRNIDLTGD
jgi:sterol desaturase/sphingolipid hydroxylase (fatty acid hydroxylase superfamily)